MYRTYVVLGTYPPSLLALWDEFNDAKVSENVRPGTLWTSVQLRAYKNASEVFPSTQAYVILVLPHGGPDLEAYTFPVKACWRQACSIFWQTTKALATAEELVSFEASLYPWPLLLT